MRTSNIANQALRHAEVGHCWEEKLSGTTGSIEVEKYATIRVRGGAGTTVTVDGILAATLAANEILILNAGNGDPTDLLKETVTIAIGAAAAFVQVARSQDRKV
jgi:hypothetical protein